MFDQEQNEKPDRHHVHAARRQILKFIGLVFGTLLILNLLGFRGYERRPYTCAACRANKVDHDFLGLKWSDQEDSDLSRWYVENVEQSHTHSWIPCTYCRRFGIPGLTTGYACTVGGPLTGLSRTVQMNIYEHFKDRLQAKRLFIRLGQGDAESYRDWAALMSWVDADYPGTWDGWWKQQSVGSQ